MGDLLAAYPLENTTGVTNSALTHWSESSLGEVPGVAVVAVLLVVVADSPAETRACPQADQHQRPTQPLHSDSETLSFSSAIYEDLS